MTAPTPEEVETVITGLREAGERRAAADRDRAEAMLDIATWVHRGQKAEIPIAEMARIAGVTRATIYAILENR